MAVQALRPCLVEGPVEKGREAQVSWPAPFGHIVESTAPEAVELRGIAPKTVGRWGHGHKMMEILFHPLEIQRGPGLTVTSKADVHVHSGIPVVGSSMYTSKLSMHAVRRGSEVLHLKYLACLPLTWDFQKVRSKMWI